MASQVNGVAHQANGQAGPPTPPNNTSPAAAAPPAPPTHPTVPLISHQDTGLTKRPRDARLIHLLLNSLGVTAYQERVPLQLLDFAYRHSSSVLSDALHLSSDSYVSQATRARDAPPGGGFRDADGQVSANAVQLAIQSRMQYQFGAAAGGGLSKEFLLETAQARNKIALPRVLQNEWGVRLPSERFVQTGVPWSLKDDWEQGDDEEGTEGEGEGMEGVETQERGEDVGVEGEEEEGGGDMADIFGEEAPDEDMDREE